MIKALGWRVQLPDHRDLMLPYRASTALPPFIDLRSSPHYQPIWDQGELGSCFPAGTRIRMKDGTLKKIEQIGRLEEVLTAEGNTGKVLSLFARKHAGELVVLKLWGHNALRMTPEHPVLTRRGYVKAKHLKEKDEIALPRYLPVSSNLIQTALHLPKRFCIRSDSKRTYAGVMGRKSLVVSVRAIPEFVVLTQGVGRIFGLFLAEGNTDNGKVVWTFGDHEKETLVAELVSLLHKEWGVEAHVQERGEHHTVKVCVYGTAWAKLFESLCGTGSGRKRLHADIAGGPIAFMESLLRGWLSGDGYASRRNEPDTGSSVSHDLALSMYDIAQALGLRPFIRWSKPTMNRHAETRQIRWEVGLLSQNDNYRISQDEKHCWRKVRGLEKEDFNDYVFNMEVEGDNSYVAESVGVHNCTAHGAPFVDQFVQIKEGKPIKMPSRLFAYWCTRLLEGTVEYDAGASVRDALKAIAKRGLPPALLWPYHIANFREQPKQEVFDAAKDRICTNYLAVRQVERVVKQSLADGYPIVFGFTVYESFDRIDSDGVMAMPTKDEKVLGGHCVAIVGYDDATRRFIVRNSWGEEWGDKGHFYMPYDYAMDGDLASDFWTIRACQ